MAKCHLLYKLQCVIGILATEKCRIRTCVLISYQTCVLIWPLEYSRFEIIHLNLSNKWNNTWELGGV